MTYPRAFSHIGITVTDLGKAVEFYTKVMGWYVIMPPTVIEHDESALGVLCDDVLGKGWGTFIVAYLATADRVGVEIFEFPNAERCENNLEYWKTGVFHFCVQDPDVEGLAAKIVQAGGKQRMPVRYYYSNDKHFRTVYCEDPFGNIFQIYSHCYELNFSLGACKLPSAS